MGGGLYFRVVNVYIILRCPITEAFVLGKLLVQSVFYVIFRYMISPLIVGVGKTEPTQCSPDVELVL